MSLKCADDIFLFCVVFFFFLGCSFALCFLFVVVHPLAVTDELWVDSNSGVAFIGANTEASFC